jgi:serine/threonine protein kinase
MAAIDGYDIVQLVRQLDHTELYRATGPGGAPIALKIHREDVNGAAADPIGREAAILTRLGGRYAPALVACGTAGRGDARPYLAAAWRSGVALLEAADTRRARPGGRAALLDLCGSVLAAYQFLHAQGVVHGDVHPGHLVVEGDGSIAVLDFGAARVLDASSPYCDAPRPPPGPYLDPASAHVLLAGRKPPPASTTSDLYGLAVLLYRLITGAHPVDFAAEPDLLLRQVLREPPLSFDRRGAPPWPALEAILIRALRKQPSRRFESVAALRRALVAIREP